MDVDKLAVFKVLGVMNPASLDIPRITFVENKRVAIGHESVLCPGVKLH